LQVSYTEDGLEAIVFTAQGDMRQALNNLQSTVNGFKHVSSENVFKVNIVQGVFFDKLDAFTTLCFTAISAPLATKRMRIWPMTQHADNISNEEKFLPLFAENRKY
jgi:hypothetical protein